MCARPIKPPTFPLTFGDWLGAYRYRGCDDSGPLSPDELGAQLGFSGATVRRWEAGTSRPSLADLSRFEAFCGLTGPEQVFLNRALGSSQYLEKPPSQERFNTLLGAVAASPYPTYVFDSLLFVRARNQLVESMISPLRRMVGRDHGLAYLFYRIAYAGSQDERFANTERLKNWLREFWLSSAHLCGSDAYISLLSSMRRVPGFEEAWLDLALRRDPAAPISRTPYISDRGKFGIWRVYLLNASLPPTYTLVEFVPQDSVAEAVLLEARRNGGSENLKIAEFPHWSLDGPVLSVDMLHQIEQIASDSEASTLSPRSLAEELAD